MKRINWIFVLLIFLASCGQATLGAKFTDLRIDNVPISDGKARLFLVADPNGYISGYCDVYIDNAAMLKEMQPGFYYADISTGKHIISISKFGSIGESIAEITVEKAIKYHILIAPLITRKMSGGLIGKAITSNVDELSYSNVDKQWFKTIKSTFHDQLMPIDETKAKEILNQSRINLKPSDPDYEKWRNKNSQTY